MIGICEYLLYYLFIFCISAVMNSSFVFFNVYNNQKTSRRNCRSVATYDDVDDDGLFQDDVSFEQELNSSNDNEDRKPAAKKSSSSSSRLTSNQRKSQRRKPKNDDDMSFEQELSSNDSDSEKQTATTSSTR